VNKIIAFKIASKLGAFEEEYREMNKKLSSNIYYIYITNDYTVFIR